jgi:hypothetical protein
VQAHTVDLPHIDSISLLTVQARYTQLPYDLLVYVLSCVERQQRLGSCSLVCRAWRDAAAAATTHVSITMPQAGSAPSQTAQCCSFNLWLSKHGRQVDSLAVELANAEKYFHVDKAPARPGLQLPCLLLRQLQQLSVTGMLLLPLTAVEKAAAASNASRSKKSIKRSLRRQRSRASRRGSLQLQAGLVGPAFLSGLSTLTRLQLDRCTLSGWADGLAGLSLLTQLQQLQLQRICVASHTNTQDNIEKTCAELGVALSHLLQLTSLELDPAGLPAAALHGLGQLQQLRELRLQDSEEMHLVDYDAACELLMQLPASLQLLHFDTSQTCYNGHHHRQLVLDKDNTAKSCQLRSLVDLKMDGPLLDDAPGLLAALTQLTSLSLGNKW